MKKMKNQNMKNLCHLIYHVKTKTDVTFSSNLILMLICTITWRGFLKSNKEKQKHSPNFFFYFYFFFCLLNKKKGIKTFNIKIIKETQKFSFWKKVLMMTFTWLIFFFFLGFLSQTFTNHRTAGEGEGIFLTPHYHFHLLYRHLDISWVITAESSPLYIANSLEPRTFGFRAQVHNH